MLEGFLYGVCMGILCTLVNYILFMKIFNISKIRAVQKKIPPQFYVLISFFYLILVFGPIFLFVIWNTEIKHSLGLNNDYPLYDIPFILLWGISIIRFGVYEAYIYKKNHPDERGGKLF